MMPVEAIALTMQALPLTRCHKCGAEPFKAFMRGEVQRSWWKCLAGWKAFLTAGPFDYCAVICSNCKSVVAWERPIDVATLMSKYAKSVKDKEKR
jgi:hypothetical protein